MIALIHMILLTLAILVAGTRLVRWLDPAGRLSLPEALAVGTGGATIIVSFAILLVAVMGGSLLFAIYSVIGIILIAGGPSFVQYALAFRFQRPRIASYQIALFFVWLALMGVIGQVLNTDSQGFPQATLIGWGDVAYHMSMIGHMALGSPFLLDQPIAAGSPLTYPFLVNFISALLARLGLPLLWAWYVPMVLFGTTLITLLFSFAQRLLHSKWYAVMMVTFMIFGGGMGWYVLGQDIQSAWKSQGLDGVRHVITHPPHEYTHLDNRTGGKPPEAEIAENIVWITPAISFFSHQRSFALGATLALIVLLGWLVYGNGPADGQAIFTRWLLLLGLLPLTHTHTALAMGILFSTLFLQNIHYRRYALRAWVLGGLGALAIASPQLLHLSHAGFTEGRQFFTPWFGWMTCTHSTSWFSCSSPSVFGPFWSAVIFWEKNFGLLFLGWLAAIRYFLFVAQEKRSAVMQLVLPSIALFLIPNLFKLQPWEFDNNKVLLYWWLCASLFTVFITRMLLKRLRPTIRVSLIVILLLVGCLAGFMDVSTRIKNTWAALRGQPLTQHAGYYGRDEVVSAQWIVHNTKPQDVFLTTDGPNNFVPILTGRPLYLGYPGWLWTQGNGPILDQRRQTINAFLETRNPAMLCADNVRWLLWERAFRTTYPAGNSLEAGQLGTIRFIQDTSSDKRAFVELKCS